MRGLKLLLLILTGAAFLALFPQNVLGQEDGDKRTVFVYVPVVVGLDGPAGGQNTFEWVTVVTFTVRPGVTDGGFYAWHYDSSGNFMQLKVSFDNGNSGEELEGWGNFAPGGSVTDYFSYCQNNKWGMCPNTNIRSGWTRYQVGQTFLKTSGWQYDTIISVVYQRRDYLARPVVVVPASYVEPNTAFIIPASVTSSGVDTGIDVINPSDQPANLSIQMYDDIGQLKGSKQQTLAAGNMLSQFLSQMLPKLPPDALGNLLTTGQLRITSDIPIAVTSLRSYSAPGFFNMGGGAAFVIK